MLYYEFGRTAAITNTIQNPKQIVQMGPVRVLFTFITVRTLDRDTFMPQLKNLSRLSALAIELRSHSPLINSIYKDITI